MRAAFFVMALRRDPIRTEISIVRRRSMIDGHAPRAEASNESRKGTIAGGFCY